ncbi:hypothetical protein QE381_001168 [Microbacterium sp. SORGH_AS 888]|nr:hypothetical protein [Microbacterium sp. SORGH_AS_0888]
MTSQQGFPVPEAAAPLSDAPQPSPGACRAVWVSKVIDPVPSAAEPAHGISFVVYFVKNWFVLRSTPAICLPWASTFSITVLAPVSGSITAALKGMPVYGCSDAPVVVYSRSAGSTSEGLSRMRSRVAPGVRKPPNWHVVRSGPSVPSDILTLPQHCMICR